MLAPRGDGGDGDGDGGDGDGYSYGGKRGCLPHAAVGGAGSGWRGKGAREGGDGDW
jgi:hypothetical protein